MLGNENIKKINNNKITLEDFLASQKLFTHPNGEYNQALADSSLMMTAKEDEVLNFFKQINSISQKLLEECGESGGADSSAKKK